MTKIVFIPARMLSAAMFAEVEAYLDGYECLNADCESDDSISAMADRAVAMLAKGEQAVFVGVSMGGYVALDAAIRHADRVKALILTATNARGDDADAARRRQTEIDAADTQFTSQMQAMAAQLLCRENDNDSSLNAFIIRETEILGKEVYKKQQRAIMLRRDSRPYLAGIKIPTLIIGGKGDKITPIGMLEELRDGIGNSHLTIIDGAGHLCPTEKPKAYADAIKAFLTTNGIS